MPSSDDYEGLGKANLKCASCGEPVHMLVVNKVLDEISGNWEEEYWCMRCFWDKGESARKQQEKGR